MVVGDGGVSMEAIVRNFLYGRVLELIAEYKLNSSSLEDLRLDEWIALLDALDFHEMPFLPVNFPNEASKLHVPKAVRAIERGRFESRLPLLRG